MQKLKSIEFNYMRETEFYLNRIIENELLSKNKIDIQIVMWRTG